MLYDQKIAEIENDIPSFGFIDDGSDADSKQIEREEDRSLNGLVEYERDF